MKRIPDAQEDGAMWQACATVEQLPVRLKRILFAADFSHAAAMALPYAVALARHFGAEIRAVHVIPPEEYAHVGAKQLEAAMRATEQTAAERIEGLAAEAGLGDVPFRIAVHRGAVTRTIAALAEKEEIDMIVAGSQGRHGLRKLFSAPVEEGIARTAICPVLLVGPEAAPPGPDGRMERVLHPIYFHPQSRRPLHCAFAMAASLGASLELLHVAEDAWKEPLATRVTAEAFCRARLIENGLPQSEYGVEPGFEVEFGPAEETIIEAARRLAAQLIVVGVPASPHPRLLSHLPGPLAYDVASHAPCPVLAVCRGEQESKSAASGSY